MDVLSGDKTEIGCNLAAWAAHVSKIRVMGLVISKSSRNFRSWSRAKNSVRVITSKIRPLRSADMRDLFSHPLSSLRKWCWCFLRTSEFRGDVRVFGFVFISSFL